MGELIRFGFSSITLLGVAALRGRFKSFMRFLLILLALVSSIVAWAQDPSATSKRPDAYIKVSTDNAGIQILEITMLKADYPQELLKSQLANLGKELGTEPRIIYAERHNPLTGQMAGGQLRVTASVPGLIRRDQSVLGLQALARAFVGAPAPNVVDGLMIQFSKEIPTKSTIRDFNEAGVISITANASPQTGVEYRISLLTQDPTKIIIPEGLEGKKPELPVKPVEKPSGLNLIVVFLIVVAAIAAGALVYSLLLRPKPRGGSR